MSNYYSTSPNYCLYSLNFALMLRQVTTIFLILTLCWTTVACGSSSNQTQSPSANNSSVRQQSNQVSSGRYEVQQATYDDGDGTYTLMLLNTPGGTSPLFRTTNLQMARLTEENIAKGEKTAVEINGAQATLYMTEDFKIEYVHNVTEVRNNPQTGQQETVVIRQESSFWSPFFGAVAGQALGSLLFRPQYSTYNQAVDQYRTKHNSPPPAVKNRQTLRSTGNLRRYPSNTSSSPNRSTTTTTKPSGSGYGSSTLKNSGKSDNVKRSPSFGSSGSRRTPSRSGFGSSKRGRR
ncbi:MAG: hypothetical protein GPJ04_06840 [Microcystis aeruginosa G13-03]|nr:hypothetical protein [Microcystis aeruginosa G13-03]